MQPLLGFVVIPFFFVDLNTTFSSVAVERERHAVRAGDRRHLALDGRLVRLLNHLGRRLARVAQAEEGLVCGSYEMHRYQSMYRVQGGWKGVHRRQHLSIPYRHRHQRRTHAPALVGAMVLALVYVYMGCLGPSCSSAVGPSTSSAKPLSAASVSALMERRLHQS